MNSFYLFRCHVTTFQRLCAEKFDTYRRWNRRRNTIYFWDRKRVVALAVSDRNTDFCKNDLRSYFKRAHYVLLFSPSSPALVIGFGKTRSRNFLRGIVENPSPTMVQRIFNFYYDLQEINNFQR